MKKIIVVWIVAFSLFSCESLDLWGLATADNSSSATTSAFSLVKVQIINANTLRAFFSEDIDSASVTAENFAISGPETVTVNSVACIDSKTVELSTTALDLNSDYIYHLTASSIKDTSGTVISTSNNNRDFQKVHIVKIVATSKSVVEVVFSENMGTGANVPSNYSISPSIGSGVSVSVNNSVVIFTASPSNMVNGNGNYSFSVAGANTVFDENGVAVTAGTSFVFSGIAREPISGTSGIGTNFTLATDGPGLFGFYQYNASYMEPWYDYSTDWGISHNPLSLSSSVGVSGVSPAISIVPDRGSGQAFYVAYVENGSGLSNVKAYAKLGSGSWNSQDVVSSSTSGQYTETDCSVVLGDLSDSSHDHVYVIYVDTMSKGLFIKKDFSGGSSLSGATPVSIISGDEISQINIKALPDRDGVAGDEIYITYYNNNQYKFYFAESNDGGDNFTIKNLDANSHRGEFNSLAVKKGLTPSQDEIYAAYYDSTNQKLLFQKSVDGGNTWLASPLVLDSATGAGKYNSIVSFGNGIFISYYFTPDNGTTGSLRFIRSLDSGNSWDIPKTIDSTSSTNVGVGTSIAASFNSADNSIYLYLFYYDSYNSQLIYSRSITGGIFWP